MKRATLTNLPAATRGRAEPADLTDRLLEREQRPKPAETAAHDAARPVKPPKRPREPAAVKRARTQAPVDLAPAGSATADSATTNSAASETAHRAASTPATVSIQAALAAADTAVQALQDAGRSAPARYELTVRYRLDALAHHVRQVREFVAGLMAR
jgi:hypothetical protein